MTSDVALQHGAHEERAMDTTRLTRALVPLGRLIFSAIFILSAVSHFMPETIEYARSQGVPSPQLLVPLSGVIALAGALSILFGYHARIGALLLLLFLVPVTLIMHDFWNVTDPAMRQMQMASFMKNLALMGGVLMFLHFGAGPYSLDASRRRRRSHVT